MENLHIGSYYYAFLLLFIPCIGILAWRYLKWKKSRREIFADARFQLFLFQNSASFFSKKYFFTLFSIGFISLIIAIVDIVGGKETILTPQKTGNILFAIDVSNSMNAEDLSPDRLSMAKNIVLHTLPSLGTDRAGAIVFAGEAKSIMPLTTDYSGMEFYIEAIETSIIKKQGTDFLKAIEEASKKFKGIEKGNRKLVLLSDGEDNEGNTQTAISLAQKEGITVISIGIGTDEGSPVPEYFAGQLMGYKTDKEGNTVLSQRQSNDLINIAKETGGTYIDGNILKETISNLEKTLKNATRNTSEISVKSENEEHYYQYPLALSLACFFFIFLLNPKKDLEI